MSKEKSDDKAVSPGSFRSTDRGKNSVDEPDTETMPTAGLPSKRPGTDHTGFQEGSYFGAYQLISKLGQGGFGQVWEAVNQDNGRRVALKVLTKVSATSQELRHRFQREGRLAASLNHPNSVFTIATEEIEGLPTISMELMPGGTLQDLIRQGPLSATRAVDYILDIVDGLEAALQKGILHRDVKPSNCFLDAQGRAKIGDFGLSKSLEVESALTATGSFLGTPSYSSPEQVRGRELDHRSDLYSVGATLYALLSGRPPFEARNSGEVLARILSEEPLPLARHGVAVPRGLRRIVLRLLRKDPRARFQSYAALRSALLSYSSRGTTSASFGQRSLAMAVDEVVLWIATVYWPLLPFGPARWKAYEAFEALTVLLVLSLPILYFLATEGKWGKSLGKLLFGLRVTDVEGVPAPFGRILGRTLIFVAVIHGPEALFLALDMLQVELGAVSPKFLVIPGAACGAIVVCLTMRRANGFAGIHELASGTRVLAVRAGEKAATEDYENPGSASSIAVGQTFGPFRVTHVVWETADAGFLIGKDEALDRNVWVHRRPCREDEPDVMQATPGRLQWLQGSRLAGRCWDAFAAPTGTGFVEWVQSRGRVEWVELRPILEGLAAELKSRIGRTYCDGSYSLRRVWIDGSCQVKLTDFPTTSVETDEAKCAQIVDWQELLAQVTRLGLEGRLPAGDDDGMPQVPLPIAVRPFVARLCAERSFENPAEVLVELNKLAGHTERITRWRRAGPPMMVGVPAAIFAFLLAFVALGAYLLGDEQSELLTMAQYAGRLQELEMTGSDKENAEMREALGRILASWASRLDLESATAKMANDVLEIFGFTVEGLIADFPASTEEELKSAEQTVLARYPDLRPGEMKSSAQILREGFIEILLLLAWVMLADLGLTLIFGGSLLLRMFGIAVQRGNGGRAGRLLCAGRAMVAWAPFLFVLTVAQYSAPQLPDMALAVSAVIILLTAAAYAVINPKRGIPDLVMGTHLVPK